MRLHSYSFKCPKASPASSKHIAVLIFDRTSLCQIEIYLFIYLFTVKQESDIFLEQPNNTFPLPEF
jgi:hypothetical protein